MLKGRDTDLYERQTGKDLAAALYDAGVKPDHTTDAADVIGLMTRVIENIRDDTPYETHIKRIEHELDFFERSDSLKFLLELDDLIRRFKTEGVVWGVGRGSSCASYILYLMEVHDINPIRYNIDFSEFSKEQ